MYWNHRLVRVSGCVSVSEVYYEAGKPTGYCKADALWCDGEELLDGPPAVSIRTQLQQMLEACDRPILNAEDIDGQA